MPVVFGKAPGKIILFGEHAVVYGQPAIAIPVKKVKATAHVIPKISSEAGQVQIEAPDIDVDADLKSLDENDPLGKAIYLTLEAVSPNHTPSFTLQISSNIPISAGMGSGAAITVAIIRALSSFLGKSLPDEKISELAYEVEKIHHGTPSGIDNNVIAYQKPVYFVRGEPIQFLSIEQPTHWVIADTGQKTPTHETVSAVRALHAADSTRFGDIFNQIGSITHNARTPLVKGELEALGWLMNENQRLLEKLSVSSPALNHLIKAARTAGAYGAKLSGGGRGGNMIALASPDKIESVEEALKQVGAKSVITTLLPKAETD